MSKIQTPLYKYSPMILPKGKKLLLKFYQQYYSYIATTLNKSNILDNSFHITAWTEKVLK